MICRRVCKCEPLLRFNPLTLAKIVCFANVSVKSKLQHAPPGNPPGIWLFWKLLLKFPPTRVKMPFKCPTLGSIQVIKCPHPGDISQAQKWQKDGGNTFRPSVVEQNLYKYNKDWETLLAYLLRTKVSCKAAEIAATRSLNAQLFFVMQHTKRSIKKIPPIEFTTSWPFHWHVQEHASSFTLLINILAVGQSR